MPNKLPLVGFLNSEPPPPYPISDVHAQSHSQAHGKAAGVMQIHVKAQLPVPDRRFSVDSNTNQTNNMFAKEYKMTTRSPAHTTAKQLNKGFTLIELMVTVAIVGIITAIALPSYTNYVKSGNAQEAPSNLLSLKTQSEQYFSDNPALGFKDFPCTSPAGAKFFQYSCTPGTGSAPINTITITATGLSGTNVSGWTYTIDQAGVRASSGIDGSSSTSCWITKSHGAC